MKEYLEKEIKKRQKGTGRQFWRITALVLVVIFGGLFYNMGYFPKWAELVIKQNSWLILITIIVVLALLFRPIFKEADEFEELDNQLEKLEAEGSSE